MPTKAAARAAQDAVRALLAANPTGALRLPMGSRQLDEERLKVVIKALARPGAAWSRVLLSRHDVGTATRDLAAVLRLNTVVTGLDLSRCAARDRELQSLGAMLLVNTTLRALDVGRNNFHEAAVCEFFTAVGRNQTLAKLAFGGNRLGSQSAETVGACLASCSSLTSLDLGDCGFDRRMAQSARRQRCLRPLCRGLAASPAIKTISLERNGWGVESAKLLADAMASASTLTCLSLSGNPVKNAGAARLAEAAAVHPSLQELHLASASVGDAGAQALAGMLLHSATMRTLDLSDNQLRDAAAVAFAAVLPSSKSLDCLHLSGGEFRVGAIEKLSQALAGGARLRHLSCGGPGASSASATLLASALLDNWFLESLNYDPMELPEFAQEVLQRNTAAEGHRSYIRQTLGAWRTAINVKKYKRYLRRKRR